MAQFWAVHTISQCSHMQTAQKNAELRDKRQTEGLLELFFLSKPWVLFSIFFGAVLNRAQFLRVLLVGGRSRVSTVNAPFNLFGAIHLYVL